MAALMMVSSLHFQYCWLSGLQNPDCVIGVSDWKVFTLALCIAVLAWIIASKKEHIPPPPGELDFFDSRFFSEDVKEYYRSHPARLRFLKRAIRRNNVNRVRAILTRDTPQRATREDYLSASELAEIYGNQEIMDLLSQSTR